MYYLSTAFLNIVRTFLLNYWYNKGYEQAQIGLAASSLSGSMMKSSENFRGWRSCRLSIRTKNWIIPLAWWIIRLRKNQSPLLKKHVTKKPKVKEASLDKDHVGLIRTAAFSEPSLGGLSLPKPKSWKPCCLLVDETEPTVRRVSAPGADARYIQIIDYFC